MYSYTQHNCLIYHHRSGALTMLWQCSTSSANSIINQNYFLQAFSQLFAFVAISIMIIFYYWRIQYVAMHQCTQYSIRNGSLCLYKPINYLSTNPKCIINSCYSIPFSSMFSDKNSLFRYSKDILPMAPYNRATRKTLFIDFQNRSPNGSFVPLFHHFELITKSKMRSLNTFL